RICTRGGITLRRRASVRGPWEDRGRMSPPDRLPDPPLTWHHVRRAGAATAAALVLLAAVPAARAWRVARVVRHVVERGGTVVAWEDPLPFADRWPAGLHRKVLDLYPVRDAYDVAFLEPPGWCGVGMTLSEGPERTGDPGDAGLAAVAELGRVRALHLGATS